MAFPYISVLFFSSECCPDYVRVTYDGADEGTDTKISKRLGKYSISDSKTTYSNITYPLFRKMSTYNNVQHTDYLFFSNARGGWEVRNQYKEYK